MDSLLENSAGWGRLAAKILADIPQQPSSLVAGQLREYQLHVSARFERSVWGEGGWWLQDCATDELHVREFHSVRAHCAEGGMRLAATGCSQGLYRGTAQASVISWRWFRHPPSPLARPYLQGLRWLVGLSDHGLNGILADDMVSNECSNG